MAFLQTPTLVFLYREERRKDESTDTAVHPGRKKEDMPIGEEEKIKEEPTNITIPNSKKKEDKPIIQKESFDFENPTIRFIHTLSEDEIIKQYDSLATNGNARLGNLKLWVVIESRGFNPDKQAQLEKFLSTYRYSLKNKLSLSTLEIDSLILADRRLYKEKDSLIQFFRSIVNRELIQYVVILNTYNYSWIHPGNLRITNPDIFLSYSLTLLECLHTIDYLMDEIADPFNNLFPDKYIFTLGSSLQPGKGTDSPISQIAEELIFEPKEECIEKLKILFDAIRKELNNREKRTEKFPIVDRDPDNCIKDIFAEIYRENELADPDVDLREKPKVKEHFLQIIQPHIKKYQPTPSWLDNYTIRCFLSILETIMEKESLTLLLTALTTHTCTREDFEKIQERIKSKLAEEIKKWEDEIYTKENEKFMKLNRYLRKKLSSIRKDLKEVLFEPILSKKKAKSSLFSKWLEKQIHNIYIKNLSKLGGKKKSISDSLKGILGKLDLTSGDRKLFIQYLIKETLELQRIGIQLNFLPEIQKISLKKMNHIKDNNYIEIIHRSFYPLQELSVMLNNTKSFNKNQWEKKVKTIVDDFFKYLDQKKPFEQPEADDTLKTTYFCNSLEFIVRKILLTEKENKTTIQSFSTQKEIQVKEELPPFMDCASNLYHCGPIKQFIFTNLVSHGLSDENKVYVYSDKFNLESLSIYGPWNEKECFSYEEERY